MPDPRVFFAAERTLLAWVRTGVAIIALGFVVARFGLVVRVLSRQFESSPMPAGRFDVSTGLGVLLTLIGTASIGAAVAQYRAFASTLSADELPPRHRTSWAVTFALAIACCGVVLAIYLVR